METQINATLEYGEGIIQSQISSDYYGGNENPNHTNNYDNFDYISSEKNPFIFHIKKIKYSLSKEYIKSLKIIYLNKKTKKEISLIETPNFSENTEVISVEFNILERIINAKVWLKDNLLIGFELKTDSDRRIKIGYGEMGEETNIPDFEDEKNYILGFGIEASHFRVSSIYFYYANINKYGNNFNIGLFELKSKLKKNEEFRKKIEVNKPDMDELHKLIIDICELPDNLFFHIITYLYDIEKY